MSRITAKKINKTIEKEICQELIVEFKAVNSEINLNKFFGKFMTASEKEMIFRRLAVMKLIEQGNKYKDIKKILDVSNNTISRAADILAGRGYGRNPNRKRKYSTIKKPTKRFKRRLKYKGSAGISGMMDDIADLIGGNSQV